MSILKAEEQQSHKSNSGTETSSLFVATQKLRELSISGPSGSSQGSLSQHTGGSGTSAITPSVSPLVFQPFQSQSS